PGGSELAQQALDVIELELRPLRIGETPPQLIENATRALHIDLARDLHGEIVAEVVTSHRPPERVGVLLCAGRTIPAGLTRSAARPLLHLLRHALRAFAQGFERAALCVYGALRILFPERALGVAHRLLGPPERLVHALPRLGL